jgi:hypothetical protein
MRLQGLFDISMTKMKDKEVRLRNEINKDLEEFGFHLKVAELHFDENESIYEYVSPMDKWVHELAEVDNIVCNRIKDAQMRYY